jgi:hypothetical protein
VPRPCPVVRRWARGADIPVGSNCGSPGLRAQATSERVVFQVGIWDPPELEHTCEEDGRKSRHRQTNSISFVYQLLNSFGADS